MATWGPRARLCQLWSMASKPMSPRCGRSCSARCRRCLPAGVRRRTRWPRHRRPWRSWQRECDVWLCVLGHRSPLMGERRRRALTPYLFAGPVVLYMVLVLLYPMGQSIVTSFTSTQLLSATPPSWVGLANYQRMLADPSFVSSIVTTISYSALVVTT